MNYIKTFEQFKNNNENIVSEVYSFQDLQLNEERAQSVTELEKVFHDVDREKLQRIADLMQEYSPKSNVFIQHGGKYYFVVGKTDKAVNEMRALKPKSSGVDKYKAPVFGGIKSFINQAIEDEKNYEVVQMGKTRFGLGHN